MSILYWNNFIETITSSISTFESISKRQLKVSIEDNPSAPLFAKILVFILGIHMIFTETAVRIVELWTID